MPFQFNSSFSRSLALLGMLGLGLVQVGCAHPVVVEPSVSVHSRIGHFPVYSQVGMPGSVYYDPPPRVIYAPPPPPRVVVVPRAHVPWGHPPAQIWGHGHDRGQRGHERRHDREDERDRGHDGRGHRDHWRH